MTLFDLDKYTKENPPESKPQFYIVLEYGDGTQRAVWKPHSDYDQLITLSELENGRKKPFRWGTAEGAKRYAAKNYPALRYTVKVWTE